MRKMLRSPLDAAKNRMYLSFRYLTRITSGYTRIGNTLIIVILLLSLLEASKYEPSVRQLRLSELCTQTINEILLHDVDRLSFISPAFEVLYSSLYILILK